MWEVMQHDRQRFGLGEELEIEILQPKPELKIKKKSKCSITTVSQFFAKPFVGGSFIYKHKMLFLAAKKPELSI